VTAIGASTVLCVDPAGEAAAVFDDVETIESRRATTVADARELARDERVDCVVAEYELPDGTGFELFEQLRAEHPNLGCVLYTAQSYGEMDDATGKTVAEYVRKAAETGPQRLRETVQTILDDRTQVGFPLPPDEDQRLDAVAEYDIPDLLAVETFDRLTALVASHFDVTVAFVGLVDEDEERFLACHGADWKALSREDSICTYAMLEEDVTVIEDVQDDRRFEHNETLQSLGIRSYAGAQITAPNGQVIGQLCVTDEQPRSYSEDERTDLALFADEAAEQLELRRRLASRGEQE